MELLGLGENQKSSKLESLSHKELVERNSIAKVGDAFRAGPRDLLIQLAEGAAPLRVMFAASVDAVAQEQAVAKLVEAGYRMDLTEPLERVAAALQSLVVKES